jgi:hypothetical protein
MKCVLHLDGRTESGGSPLIMHNERLADPMDSFVQALGAVTSKRKKTLEDHAEIAHIEFLGGLYTTPALAWPMNGTAKARPAIPAWNVLRCLQDGGARQKRGKDVPRGVYPLAEFATLTFDGPSDAAGLWKAGTFALRKSVGVQRSRTMRTRPIFTDWQAELPIEVDDTIFDQHILGAIWHDAGIYAGLGDMRPVYGRFVGTLDKVEVSAKGGKR